MKMDFDNQYPVWFLISEDSLIWNGDEARLVEPPSFLLLTNDAKESTLPVFSSEVSATKFVRASGVNDAQLIAADDPQQFKARLENAKGSGVMWVVFDPEKAIGWTRRTWAIDSVLSWL